MADETSLEQLKTQVMQGAEETKSYLDQLKKKVGDFDEKGDPSKRAETATKYLDDALANARKTIDELEEAGHELMGDSAISSAADQSVSMVESGLVSAQKALKLIQCRAIEYDSKYLDSRGAEAAESVSETVHGLVNAGRQRAMDAMEKSSEMVKRIREIVLVATGEAVQLGEKGDEMLGVSNKASGVVQRVKELDERMCVTATATTVDTKVASGMGRKVVEKGMEMVQETIEYVTETLHQAKLAANKSESAQAVETKSKAMAESAQQSAETTKATASEKATEVKMQAQVEAAEVKDAAVDLASTAREKISSAVEGAYKSAEDASDWAEEVADKADEMAEQAKQSGSDEVGETMSQAQGKKAEAAASGKRTDESVGKTLQCMVENTKKAAEDASKKGEQTTQTGAEKTNEMTSGVESDSLGQSVTNKPQKKAKKALDHARVAATTPSTSTTSSKDGTASGATKQGDTRSS